MIRFSVSFEPCVVSSVIFGHGCEVAVCHSGTLKCSLTVLPPTRQCLVAADVLSRSAQQHQVPETVFLHLINRRLLFLCRTVASFCGLHSQGRRRQIKTKLVAFWQQPHCVYDCVLFGWFCPDIFSLNIQHAGTTARNNRADTEFLFTETEQLSCRLRSAGILWQPGTHSMEISFLHFTAASLEPLASHTGSTCEYRHPHKKTTKPEGQCTHSLFLTPCAGRRLYCRAA